MVCCRRVPWTPGATRARGRALSWLAALAIAAAACTPPAPVVQGKVLAGSAGAGELLVQDELRPESRPLRFDTSRAEVGAEPRPGDLVRVVYRESGGVRRALAVMNVTRQAGAAGEHR